ncbi:hypothetical protein IGI04_002817, partial [Brassica rapa subsp. trilocularis]
QNAERWRDFQATSDVHRAKAGSSVVGPQKIESPIQKREPKFDTNKVTYLSHSIGMLLIGSSSIYNTQQRPPLLNFAHQLRFHRGDDYPDDDMTGAQHVT